ncbi:MAG TPA: FAD-dependent oxidoreductase [Solirubrobacteraceae bacterium]
MTDAPSWWWADLGGLPAPRPALDGDREADVCIVGAGYTGLWTAYELLRADPSLAVVLLEREVAGFGASGRNGGWVLGEVSTGSRQREAAGEAAVAALERAIQATVDEVGDACAREGIDCDFVKGGSLTVAQTEPQLARLHDAPRGALLDVDEAAARVRVAGLRGARYTPHCARVQPAKLVRGLAAAVERRGGTIHEGTAALDIAPRRVRTGSGTVRARWVVRATEGYTAGLPGLERALLPLSSSMIVTEPLDGATWAQIGWAGCETLDDAAHAYIYAQRTADGRIAIGGRGRPYRFGSSTDRAGEIPEATVRQLRARLTRLFPILSDVRLDGAWTGVFGVARDWAASVHCDRDSGLCWAGGYAGEGVAAANLAARTLRDLILDRDTELARLPWVGHHARGWEPEPLRWLAVQTVYGAFRAADALEDRTGRSSWLAGAAGALAGR